MGLAATVASVRRPPTRRHAIRRLWYRRCRVRPLPLAPRSRALSSISALATCWPRRIRGFSDEHMLLLFLKERFRPPTRAADSSRRCRATAPRTAASAGRLRETRGSPRARSRPLAPRAAARRTCCTTAPSWPKACSAASPPHRPQTTFPPTFRRSHRHTFRQTQSGGPRWPERSESDAEIHF